MANTKISCFNPIGRIKFCFFQLIFQLLLHGCATGGTSPKVLTHVDRARMFVEIANGALVEGDPSAALQAIARAEAEDTSLAELYHTKALAFYVKHDLNTAIQSGQKAVEMRPTYSDAKNTLGKLFLEAGRDKEAMLNLSQAANDPLYSDSYKAWTNLGILKYKKNELTQSAKYFNHAIQDAPGRSCIAHYYLGHIRLKELRFSEAIQEYDNSIKKLCVKFRDGMLALGIAYQKDKQYQAARKTFLEIQKRYPNTQLADQAMDHLKYLP
jgi:type IV pilus assembly protein PilF